jgi:hypothetical protein
VKLGYDIDIADKTLKNNDHFIAEQLELIMENIKSRSKTDHYYHAEIEFKDNMNEIEITVYIDIESKDTTDGHDFAVENVDLEINENESMYRFYVSIDNEVN